MDISGEEALFRYSVSCLSEKVRNRFYVNRRKVIREVETLVEMLDLAKKASAEVPPVSDVYAFRDHPPSLSPNYWRFTYSHSLA